MKNWKSFTIIFLILAVVGVIIYRNYFANQFIISETSASATFKNDQNLALVQGNKLPIEFNVEKGVSEVSITFGDSVLQSWKNPKSNYKINIDTRFFQMGVYELTLKSVLDGVESLSTINIQLVSDLFPASKKLRVVQVFPHNPLSFTQGLEFNNGQLYEGTGQYGESNVMNVNLNSGLIGKKMGLDATYFGEGITVMGNALFQITWKEGKAFRYDKNTMLIKDDYNYSGEGWGLCNDGKNIIMSDGSEKITFRDTSNFEVIRSINVYDNVGPRTFLNELEYIDGKIYANVWQQEFILVIDPKTGKVLEEIDASEAAKIGRGTGEVLNGIAYNSLNKKLYVTGKNWIKLLEVVVE